MPATSKSPWTTPRIDLLRTVSSAESGLGVSNSETLDVKGGSFVASGPQ